MRLVLLGGSGFLGQSLLRQLEQTGERGQYKIVVYDPNPPRFFPGDVFARGLLEETERLRDLLEPGDFVVHMVHLPLASEMAEADAGFLEKHLSPSLRLVELLRSNAAAGLFFFSSGGTVYGEPGQRRPIPEDAPLKPGSAYAAVKVKIEQAILAGEKAGLKYIILRPGNPFGPLQAELNRHGAVAQILKSLALDREFVVYGEGGNVRDYFYIDDLIGAFRHLLARLRWNRIYNVGSGEGTSLNRLIELCQEVTGRKLRKQLMPCRPGDLRYNVLDPRGLMREGWRPQIPLREGIARTWDSLK